MFLFTSNLGLFAFGKHLEIQLNAFGIKKKKKENLASLYATEKGGGDETREGWETHLVSTDTQARRMQQLKQSPVFFSACL